jgi:hypothetical protein
VKSDDISVWIESCWKMGGIGDKSVMESNGRRWTDKHKVYQQWEYTEKPFWTYT